MKEVDARDEIESIGEGADADLRGDRSLANHHCGGVPVKSVRHQHLAFDVIHGDRRQPIPRIGVSLDREVVQPISQVEVGIENQVVQGYITNVHRGRSHVAHA